MKRILAMLMSVVMLTGVIAFAGCSKEKDDTSTTSDVLKVGVLYISPKTDGGYSQAHAEGIAQAKDALGDKIEVIEIESISDTDTELTASSIDSLVSQGCTLIFTTSYGYMEATAAAAEKYPDVYFCHCSGYTMNDTNMDVYFGQIESARYLAGIVAGLMTETDKLGYVAAYPIPECIRGINAYTLGAQSVNPDVTVTVVWTNTWFDLNAEKAAAESLLADGVDVMAQHQDSPAAINAAEEAGAYAIGYDLAYADAADAYLTAPLWNWGTYYTYKIQQVVDGDWKIENYWGGMKEGVVTLDTLSSLVSDEAVAAVEAATPDVTENGNAYVFSGPITDQDGTVRVEEGDSLSYADQMSMDWFVAGVIGNPAG